MKPLRILHVFGRMDRGGAEMRTLEVMRVIDRRRYQFEFAVTSGQAGILDTQIRALGGEVHPVPLGPGFPRRFAALLRQGQYDAVHTHVHYFGGLPLAIAALCRVPVRIVHFRTTHDGRRDTLPRRIQRTLLRQILNLTATSVLGVSRSALGSAWGADWTRDPRCRVVYNGIDLSLFAAPTDRVSVRERLGLAPDTLLVLHVARLDPSKNHGRLLRIFREVARRHPEAHLVLAGPKLGAEGSTLLASLRELGLADRVTLAGCRADVPQLMAAADLMIFPSVREGLPGVLLEAAAAGLPVLASDIPPNREIAEQLPMVVETCSLERDDVEWAARASSIIAHYPWHEREGLGQVLTHTSFRLEATVRAFEAAYHGGLA